MEGTDVRVHTSAGTGAGGRQCGGAGGGGGAQASGAATGQRPGMQVTPGGEDGGLCCMEGHGVSEGTGREMHLTTL